MGPARPSSSTVLKNYLPSCFSVSGFNIMTVEAHVLKNRGISESLITKMKAKNSTYYKVYHWTWEAYVTRCESLGVLRGMNDLLLAVGSGLTFESQHQAPELSILIKRPLASHFLMKTFFQGSLPCNFPCLFLHDIWNVFSLHFRSQHLNPLETFLSATRQFWSLVQMFSRFYQVDISHSSASFCVRAFRWLLTADTPRFRLFTLYFTPQTAFGCPEGLTLPVSHNGQERK